MTDKKPEQEKDATPRGAVEIDEKDLDKAAGGETLTFAKIKVSYKPPPQEAPIIPPPDDTKTV